MSVWRKLVTAVKGGANEAAEAVVDANIIRILDQEIREAKSAMAKARDEKARMTANRTLKEKSVAEMMSQVERRTEAARTAKENGDEALAVEIIESILKIRNQVEEDQALADQYRQTEEGMDNALKQAQSRLETLQRKVQSVKANEALLKAQQASAINVGASSSRLSSAMDSLEKLENRQAQQQAVLAASEEDARQVTGEALEDKIKALERPGGHDVQAILAKL